MSEEPKPKQVDLTRHLGLITEEVAAQADDLFSYHNLTSDQMDRISMVREHLLMAYTTVLSHAPPSPMRTRALNMIFDARALANAAIAMNGRY